MTSSLQKPLLERRKSAHLNAIVLCRPSTLHGSRRRLSLFLSFLVFLFPSLQCGRCGGTWNVCFMGTRFGDLCRLVAKRLMGYVAESPFWDLCFDFINPDCSFAPLVTQRTRRISREQRLLALCLQPAARTERAFHKVEGGQINKLTSVPSGPDAWLNVSLTEVWVPSVTSQMAVF